MNRPEPELSSESLRISRRGVLGSILTGCAALVGLSQTAEAQMATASGVVYVGNNSALPGQNAVLAFRRAADGTLTPLPGSPFLTRGTGQGNPNDLIGPLDSDQEIIITPDKRFLLAVNSGSNTIAVFTILRDGRLVHVSGSPFPSGGLNPVSLGYAAGKVYVVNKNEDEAQFPNMALPNFTGFKFSSAGRLTPIPNSTFNLPAGSSPNQALISPDNRFIYGPEIAVAISPQSFPNPIRAGIPVLRGLRIGTAGRLTEVPGSPLVVPPFAVPPASQLPIAPPDARIPLGLIHHPTAPVLYAGIVSSGSVAAFSVNQTTGAYTFANAAILTGAAPCWLAINSAGNRVYAVNTLSNSVSVLDTSNPLNPVEIQPFFLPGPPDPINVALDPSGNFLYVLSQRTNGFPAPGASNAVYTLAIAPDGTLSNVPGSPLLLSQAADTRIKGLAVL